jgi:hypothetical protein
MNGGAAKGAALAPVKDVAYGFWFLRYAAPPKFLQAGTLSLDRSTQHSA